MSNPSRNILIVEDSPEDLEMYKRFLSKDMHFDNNFIESDNGEEGIERLSDSNIDCVVLDYRLPDLDGIEFLQQIKSADGDVRVPVIILTGQGNERVAVEAMKNGASDYLVKGELNPDLLIRSVRYAVERKKADNTLKEHLSFMNTLIDTIPNPICYKNNDMIMVGCNRAFEELVRLPKKSILGKTVYDVYPKDLADFVNETDRRLLGEPGIRVFESTMEGLGGQIRELICYRATYPDSRGNVGGIVGIMLDITQRKQSEVELQKAKHELELNLSELRKANRKILDHQKTVIEEERLKVLLQIAGATAHELNQPLTALLGNIELMRLNIDRPDQLMNNIYRIEEAGRRVASIVDKIQNIRHDDTKQYYDGVNIINLDQRINILSVEDSYADFNVLETLIRDIGNVNITHASSMKQAVVKLEDHNFDLILLDHILPDGTSLDFMSVMEEKEFDIPVVIVTGQGDEMVASQVIQIGAYDYLPKSNLNHDSLSRVITNSMEKFRLKKEAQLAMEKMAYMSIRDELTGLYNRRFFMEVLERELSRAMRYNSKLVLCMIDLDHFKNINVTYGRLAGDKALSDIGKKLKESLRQSDLVCRYGGEEFAAIFPNTDLEHAYFVSERFRNSIAESVFSYQTSTFRLTVSIGMAGFDHPYTLTGTEVIRKADEALFQAKSKGRNVVIRNI